MHILHTVGSTPDWKVCFLHAEDIFQSDLRAWKTEEARKKEAKINRRTAKAALTRCGKTVNKLLSGNQPESEVKDSLAKYQESFGRLVELHEQYVKLIEDDNEFEMEEEWLGQCQERFMEIEYLAKVYIEDSIGRGKEKKGKSKALASKNGKQDLSASTSSMNEEIVSEANSNGTIKTSGQRRI